MNPQLEKVLDRICFVNFSVLMFFGFLGALRAMILFEDSFPHFIIFVVSSIGLILFGNEIEKEIGKDNNESV